MKDLRVQDIYRELEQLPPHEQLEYLFAAIDRERELPARKRNPALIEACSDLACRIALESLPELTSDRIEQIKQENDGVVRARHTAAPHSPAAEHRAKPHTGSPPFPRSAASPRFRAAKRTLIAIALLYSLLCSLVVVASAKAAEMSVGEYLISVVTTTAAAETSANTALSTAQPPVTEAPPPATEKQEHPPVVEPTYEDELQELLDWCHRIRLDTQALAAQGKADCFPAALPAMLDAAIAGRSPLHSLPSTVTDSAPLTVPYAFRSALLRMIETYPDFATQEGNMVQLIGWSTSDQLATPLTRDSISSACYDLLFPQTADWTTVKNQTGCYVLDCGDYPGELLLEYGTYRIGNSRRDDLLNRTFRGSIPLNEHYGVVCVTPIHPLGAHGEPYYFFFPENDPYLKVELVCEGNRFFLRASDAVDIWYLPVTSSQTKGSVASILEVLERFPAVTEITVNQLDLSAWELPTDRHATASVTKLHLIATTLPQSLDLSGFPALNDLSVSGKYGLHELTLAPECQTLARLRICGTELNSAAFLGQVKEIGILDWYNSTIFASGALNEIAIDTLQIDPNLDHDLEPLNSMRALRSILVTSRKSKWYWTFDRLHLDEKGIMIQFSEP